MNKEKTTMRPARGYGTFAKGQRHLRQHSMQMRPGHPLPRLDSDNFRALGSFLSDLNHRLDFIESYGNFKIDTGVEYAYSTLLAVRNSCYNISNGTLEVGRRQASVFVETLESRYLNALETKETLAEKVLEGILVMEDWVSDLETRAYAIRDAGLDTMNHVLERPKVVVDASMHKEHRARKSIELKYDSNIQEALLRAKEQGLIRFEDLPEPWQVNPNIRSGYRFCDGHWACIRSIMSIHNESCNIWSHLLGIFLVLGVAFHFYPQHMNFHASSTADVFIASLFFFAAIKCLLCSCTMHTMNSIAHRGLLARYACVDYTGISLLVGASIMSVEYTALYCEPISQIAYMAFTAVLSVGGVYLPWNPTFNRKDLAWVRVLFYVTLAMTCFLPSGQLIWKHGLEYTAAFYGPVSKSMLVYLGGAVIYASKVPERWFPGRFDYFGTAHNIWHIAVLGGIVTHYFAMQEMFSHAHNRAAAQCPAAY
ncbi:adiponectin receptor protein 1 [Lentithecium fluviatile CBS 122367]|uniref:Adiponectin receptor protein 1 n=1 Tax=Lentithecium fluviatile CBS 122367 TaxID=1168545 RepID=A0A6G1J026_9PLEO|nr:adiponectin receptor protein 1 [Lentithecium fluviatile CBS 122367]